MADHETVFANQRASRTTAEILSAIMYDLNLGPSVTPSELSVHEVVGGRTAQGPESGRNSSVRVIRSADPVYHVEVPSPPPRGYYRVRPFRLMFCRSGGAPMFRRSVFRREVPKGSLRKTITQLIFSCSFSSFPLLRTTHARVCVHLPEGPHLLLLQCTSSIHCHDTCDIPRRSRTKSISSDLFPRYVEPPNITRGRPAVVLGCAVFRG